MKSEKEELKKIKRDFRKLHKDVKTIEFDEKHFPSIDSDDKRILKDLIRTYKDFKKIYKLYAEWEKDYEKEKYIYTEDPDEAKEGERLRKRMTDAEIGLIKVDTVAKNNLNKTEKEVFEKIRNARNNGIKQFYGKFVLSVIESMKNLWHVIAKDIKLKGENINNKTIYRKMLDSRLKIA